MPASSEPSARLRRLIEREGRLETGETVGMLVFMEGVEVQVSDPALRSRLQDLLAQPLRLRARVEWPVCPGEPGFRAALTERLRQKDFRLQVD